MAGPDPAVAAVRLAVRRSLAGAELAMEEPARAGATALVLAACSGGADSLALAAAVAFEAPRLGLAAGGVTVDHGLQPGSAEQAAKVAATLAELGLDPVYAVRVDVPRRDDAGDRSGALEGGARYEYPGPEAAARQARYAAIDEVAGQCAAAAVMLGHTMDDQAETVLLGLARGSGARSLAGMPAAAGRYLRPLLGVRRAQTGAACAAQGLEPWDDPQNADEAFARVRVRKLIMPQLEAQLGPGITEALARSAILLRADAGALDGLAGDAAGPLLRDWPPAGAAGGDRCIDIAALAAMQDAIRTRLLRTAAIAAGAPPGSLTARHVADLDALITDWHGQRWVDLPGGVRCQRRYGRLHFTSRM